jgi:hypothetical protein
VQADFRDHPRFLVNMTATIELRGGAVPARVYDLSRGGTRIELIAGLTSGDKIAVTFEGYRRVEGRIAWISTRHVGIRFERLFLELDELNRLVGPNAVEA